MANTETINEHDTKENVAPCDINSCKSVKRIGHALDFYDSQKDAEDMHGFLNDYFHKHRDILSCYHHILQEHNDIASFTLLCGLFTKRLPNKSCPISECTQFERHQHCDDRRHLNRPPSNVECYVTTELFDTIHCYFIHSFDIGYRIPRKILADITYDNTNDANDANDINRVECTNTTLQALKQYISAQRAKFKNNDIKPLSQRFTRSLSDIRPFSNKSFDSIISYHEFGTMDGWIYRKQNDTTHRTQKYKDLKYEILNNRVHTISMTLYKIYTHKANLYSTHSNTVKRIRSSNATLCSQHNIEMDQFMSLNHVLSIILWCDNPSLNTALCNTFKTKYDEDKRIHNEYYHWGTYLIQNVECFGDALQSNQRFYHCVIPVSTELTDYYFTDFALKYCSPTSLTSQLPVAILSDRSHNGVILELHKHSPDINDELRYFDCSIFSSHSNTREQLFFGGLHPLKICNITINDDANRSFEPLIDAFALLDHVTRGEKYDRCDKYMVNLIERLSKKDHTLPEYALRIFDRFCYSRKEIVIDLMWLNLDYPLLKEYLLSTDDILFISKLTGMFNNCVSIKIVNDNENERISISSLYLTQVLIELTNEDNARVFDDSSLKEISYINVQLDAQCKNPKVLQMHKMAFNEKNYEFTYGLLNNGQHDIILTRKALEETQEYIDIKRYIQDKLSINLSIPRTDTHPTQKEYELHSKPSKRKTKQHIEQELEHCSASKSPKLDVYTHCECAQRLCIVLTAYRKIVCSYKLCRNVSLLPILTFDGLYGLVEIENDFAHVRAHIDENPDAENELHRKFKKEFECDHVACRRRYGRRQRWRYKYHFHPDDENAVWNQTMDKIHQFMVHTKFTDDEDQERLSVGSAEELNAPKGKAYIGKKEDDIWWKYHESKTEEMEDDEMDEPIYDELVKRMGVFRWQCPHGFNPEQHRGLMHLKPKYKNVKEEALQNTHNSLSNDNWNQTLRKSEVFNKSFARRRIKTSYVGKFEDQISGVCNRWNVGEDISLHEIVTLKLYTDFDKLQYELKKCFRFDSNTDDRLSLEDRLRQFYHWRIKLLTVLNKFGQQLSGKRHLYHGVNAKMILYTGKGTRSTFYGPLSTSAAYHVARTFATAKGMVLEITTQYPRLGMCRAFDASLISDYPEEKEWLIGFIYLRMLKVITRPLHRSWNTFQDMNKMDEFPIIPLSSKTRSIFFAVHLFGEQVFAMSVHSEYWLCSFLYVQCGYNETEENNDNGRIQSSTFAQMLQNDIASVRGSDMIVRKDTDSKPATKEQQQYYRILNIAWRKFKKFRLFPNDHQVVRMDEISPNLKPYFMDFVGMDLHKKEKYRISFAKIGKIYVNVKEIYFINAYEFNNSVLEQFIQYLDTKQCTLTKVKWIFNEYNKRFFLSQIEEVWLDKLEQKEWGIRIRDKEQSGIGYQIQLYMLPSSDLSIAIID